MSALTLGIRWSRQVKSEIPLVSHGSETLASRIGVHFHERRCPACNSIVYSRRHSRCGVCEQILPTNCLFNIAEAEKVKALIRTERQRHKAWLMRIEDGRQ